MKDKLVKTGHKKHYYRFRNLLLGLLITGAIGGLFSIPVIVSYNVALELSASKTTQKVEVPSKQSLDFTLLHFEG